jgi:hypothetical protein
MAGHDDQRRRFVRDPGLLAGAAATGFLRESLGQQPDPIPLDGLNTAPSETRDETSCCSAVVAAR